MWNGLRRAAPARPRTEHFVRTTGMRQQANDSRPSNSTREASLIRVSITACILSGAMLAGPAVSADFGGTLSHDIAREYAHPHELVDVGNGRKMNLFCRGGGIVTVVFDSGLSDWSSIWALVQPQVAERARACAYDRAGMGYSDPAQRPSTPENIIVDLHTLLTNAGIRAPIVLVGHSRGGFNMKLYAATYSSEVAGLVLVDPSEERGEERVGGLVKAKFGDDVATKVRDFESAEFNSSIAQCLVCTDAAREHDLDPNTELYKSCTDPLHRRLGPEIAAARQAIQVRLAYQAAQASEFANGPHAPGHLREVNYAKLFGGKYPLGNMPLIVLSHSLVDMTEPFAEVEMYKLLQLHENTAALSSRGAHRMVPDTQHNIEVDHPEAIVDAINEILNALSSPRTH